VLFSTKVLAACVLGKQESDSYIALAWEFCFTTGNNQSCSSLKAALTGIIVFEIAS
jgi:hypothetical protein